MAAAKWRAKQAEQVSGSAECLVKVCVCMNLERHRWQPQCGVQSRRSRCVEVQSAL